MLHRKNLWRRIRWPSIVIAGAILLVWIISTRWPMSGAFDVWGIESFGGLIVVRQWESGGPAYETSGDAVTEALGHWGWELPTASIGRYGISYLSIPFWVLFLPIASLACLATWRMGKRYPRDACPECGYSMIGSTSGRCPECGMRRTASLDVEP